MKKQIDTLRNSMKANKGLMDTKMAAVVEVLCLLLSNSLGYIRTYVCIYSGVLLRNARRRGIPSTHSSESFRDSKKQN